MDMLKTRKEEERMGQHTVLGLGEGASESSALEEGF